MLFGACFPQAVHTDEAKNRHVGDEEFWEKKIASWGLSLCGGLAQVRWAWPMGKAEMKVLQNRLEVHQPGHSEFPLRLQEALKLEKANQQSFVIPTLPLARRQLLSLGPFQVAVYLPCMMIESFEVSRCPFQKHF